MNFNVNQSILDKYQISLEEFLVLYLNSKNVDIKKCSESLVNKGFAEENSFSEGQLIISSNIKELIFSVLIDSDKKVLDKDEEFIALANELRELYPTGRKEGTTYMWRGTAAEVAKKLKTLIVKYGYKFTREQAIKATKEYVSSFNGNYTKMRLLKYFILKLEKDMDNNVNIISEFMSLIENENDILETNNWKEELV